MKIPREGLILSHQQLGPLDVVEMPEFYWSAYGMLHRRNTCLKDQECVCVCRGGTHRGMDLDWGSSPGEAFGNTTRWRWGEKPHLAMWNMDQEIIVIGDNLNLLPRGKRVNHVTFCPAISACPPCESGQCFLVFPILRLFLGHILWSLSTSPLRKA